RLVQTPELEVHQPPIVEHEQIPRTPAERLLEVPEGALPVAAQAPGDGAAVIVPEILRRQPSRALEVPDRPPELASIPAEVRAHVQRLRAGGGGGGVHELLRSGARRELRLFRRLDITVGGPE